jgi:hypothetical protein
MGRKTVKRIFPSEVIPTRQRKSFQRDASGMAKISSRTGASRDGKCDGKCDVCLLVDDLKFTIQSGENILVMSKSSN